MSYRIRSHIQSKAISWLNYHRIKSFYSFIDDSTFEEGARAFMQTAGMGKLKPNIVLMGYKSDWRKCALEDLNMYFEVLQ